MELRQGDGQEDGRKLLPTSTATVLQALKREKNKGCSSLRISFLTKDQDFVLNIEGFWFSEKERGKRAFDSPKKEHEPCLTLSRSVTLA